MRVPVTGWLLALGACSGALARPLQCAAALHYNHYQSDSGVLVSTPAFDFNTELDTRTALALQYNLDAVSAASFNYAQSKTHRGKRPPGTCWQCHASTDALSGATRFYTETRQGLSFKVTRKNEALAAAVGGVINRENDYQSEQASLRFEGSTLRQNLTLAVTGQLAQDRVGAVTRSLNEGMQTTAVDFTATAVLSRLTLLQAGWGFAEFLGYQQNPYAWVQVGPLDTTPARASQPLRRQRHAATASLKQGLGWESALQADYRYYTDSWDVVSHTLDLTLSKQIAGLVLEPSLRFYAQPRAAYFFKNRYGVKEEYMTRDLKLAAFETQMISLSLRGAINDNWGCQLSYALYQRRDNLDYSLYFADKPETANLFQLVVTYE